MTTTLPIAWKIDATDFASGGVGVFVPTSPFDNFKQDPQKRIFAGGKGMGKSLLLQKNCLHLSSKGGHLFLPRNNNQRVELMGKLAITFDSETMRNRAHTIDSTDWWELVWSVSFATVGIFHAARDFVVCDVWNWLGIGPAMRISAPEMRGDLLVHQVVHALVIEQKSREQLGAAFAKLRPALSKLVSTVVISIDNVDEAFQPGDQPEKEEQRAIEKDVWNLGGDFSVTAQIGLLAAIRALRPYESLQVYATMRIEALDKRMASQHPLFRQERALCLELRCDKELSRMIFEANIEATPDEQCARPDTRENPYVRFVGFDFISSGSKGGAEEHVFDFLYRHTLGMPRDLVEVGKHLSELGAGNRTIQDVQDLIYRNAGRCLNVFESALLPAWDRRWTSAFGEFGCNVLSENEIVRLSRRIESKHKIHDPITYLVNRGLIGYLRRNDGQESDEIHFRPPFRYITERKVKVNRSSYYFLHPVLHGAVRSANNAFIVDREVVVGNGYSFKRQAEWNQLRFACPDEAGLTVEFDGRTVLAFLSETNIVVPIFAAIACAAWDSRNATVPFRLFADELRKIMKSRIVQVRIHGQPLEDFIARWEDGGEGCNADMEEAVAHINIILRRHMRNDSPTGNGSNSDEMEYVKWNGSTFEFLLCDPSKIDCGRFCEEVRRRGEG